MRAQHDSCSSANVVGIAASRGSSFLGLGFPRLPVSVLFVLSVCGLASSSFAAPPAGDGTDVLISWGDSGSGPIDLSWSDAVGGWVGTDNGVVFSGDVFTLMPDGTLSVDGTAPGGYGGTAVISGVSIASDGSVDFSSATVSSGGIPDGTSTLSGDGAGSGGWGSGGGGSGGGQDSPISISGTDFDWNYVIPLTVAGAGAWLIGALFLKGGIAGVAGVFRLVYRGGARLVGGDVAADPRPSRNGWFHIPGQGDFHEDDIPF